MSFLFHQAVFFSRYASAFSSLSSNTRFAFNVLDLVSVAHVMMRLVVALRDLVCCWIYHFPRIVSTRYPILLASERSNSSSSSNFHSRLLAFFLRLPSYFGYLVAPSLPWSMLLLPIDDLSLAIFTNLLSSILFIRPSRSIFRWCIHLFASSIWLLHELLASYFIQCFSLSPDWIIEASLSY